MVSRFPGGGEEVDPRRATVLSSFLILSTVQTTDFPAHMRIGIDASLLLRERSGIAQYIHHLVSALGKIDSQNQYLLGFMSGKRGQSAIPSYEYSNFSSSTVEYSSRQLQIATGLGRWRLPARCYPFDGVDIMHWPNYLVLPGVSGKQVVTICDLTFLMFPDQHPWFRAKGLSWAVRRSVAEANAVMVISECTKRDAVKYLGVPESKIHVTYCGTSSRFQPISFEQRRPVLGKYQLPTDGYLLYVGNIEPRKNLVRLVEAYALLKKQMTCQFPLILAGGAGWKNEAVHKRIEDMALGGAVRLIGYVSDEDLPAVISGATLFLYPSLYEGFGLPPLEAMACGIPVVTSNTSSLPEVVGDAAFTVDPYDVEGFTKAIGQLLTDQELQNEMRNRGLARAKQFSWERTARETLKVYEMVQAKRPPG
jgi:glycosyltransferase involved in cell wall biosynthesis